MRRIVIVLRPSWLLIVVLFQINLTAQQSVEQTTISPREEIAEILRKAEPYIHYQLDSAQFYLSKAISLSKGIADDSLLMESYFAYCRFAQMKTEFDSSLYYTRKAGAIAFANSYTNNYGEYYNFLARYHKYLNHFDSALYYMHVYDTFLENRGEDHKRWVSQQSLALFYLDFPDLEKAGYHIEQALNYARIRKTPKNYLYILYIAIDIFSRQDSLVKVSRLNEEYLKFKLERGDNILENSLHAHLLLPSSDSVDRLAIVQKYLPVHLEHGDTLSAITSYHVIGTLNKTSGNLKDAITAYEDGVSLSKSYGYPNLRYIGHAALFELYDEQQDHERALMHHKAMTAIQDTIRNAEREKIMHDLEVQYNTAEKEHDLAEANYQLEVARRTQQLYTLGGGILILFLGFIFYAYRQKRKSLALLAEKNAIITKSLAEKDILLREIHHRVKNNLQMISALLYLHGKSVEDTSAQEALMESQNRVQSMAMIHQNLYQDTNMLSVGVKTYLDKLLNHLIGSYNIEKDRIDIKTRIEIEHLDVDTIVPLALIVNELISNSLKYAFRDGRKGLVEVFIGHVNDSIQVEVSDNGIGFPAGFSVETASNFGYKLIQILSERLGAKLITASGNGTHVSLSIPMKKAA